MLSTQQIGQVHAAREYWDSNVKPLAEDPKQITDEVDGDDPESVALRNTLAVWATNHGVEVLATAEYAVGECDRLAKKVRDLGGDPS